MSDLVSFKFENLNVRAIEREGEPWFVAVDVCRVLGLTEVTKALLTLDEDEKTTLNTIRGETGPKFGARGAPTLNIINESGLYTLIMKSRKPAAKLFRKWVTAEILPAIRKTGGYIQVAPDESPEALILRAMTVLQDTVERQKRQLAEVKPKADGFDLIADARGSLNLTETAKVLQLPPQMFMRSLAAEGIIYKRTGNNNWLGKAQYVNAGYLTHKAATIYTPYGSQIVEIVRVTPRGLTWLSGRQVRRAAA